MGLDWEENWQDADVVLKSEWHHSKADLEEEHQAINSGEFDAVVFELPRESIEETAKTTLSDWIIGVPLFFLSSMYTESLPLLVSAYKYDLDVAYTRESDGDVLSGLPWGIDIPLSGLILALLFLTPVFFVTGVAFTLGSGLEGGLFYFQLSIGAFAAAFASPLLIRIIRGRFGSSTNRNQIMADRIAKISKTNEKTLAILGSSHSEPVEDRLPNELDVYQRSPVHPFPSLHWVITFGKGGAMVLTLIIGIWVGVGILMTSIIFLVLTLLF